MRIAIIVELIGIAVTVISIIVTVISIYTTEKHMNQKSNRPLQR